MMTARIDDLSKREQAALARWAEMRAMSVHFIDAAARRHWQNCPERARWVVLRVRPRCESRVAEWLEERGIETFLPVRKEKYINRRRREALEKERAVLPGYLFVRCMVGAAAISGLDGLKREGGIYPHAGDVHGIMISTDGFAHQVSPERMNKFIDMCSVVEKVQDAPEVRFRRGDNVLVGFGPFEGMSGFVRKIIRRQPRVVVELRGFENAPEIDFPVAMLEKL
nr:transcription termination/antitermination NusG family protein [uncultured Martelella sp.]